VYDSAEPCKGFSCTTLKFEKYVNDYSKSLKKYMRLTLLWIIFVAIIIGVLSALNIHVFSKIEMGLYFFIITPFFINKIWITYNAPKELEKGKNQVTGLRNQSELIDSRIKGMNPAILYLLLCVSAYGVYQTVTDIDPLINKPLYIICYSALLVLAIGILWKQKTILKKEKNILEEENNRSISEDIASISEKFFVENEFFFFEKMTKHMLKKKRKAFKEDILRLKESADRIFQIFNCTNIHEGHTSYSVDWKDTETLLYSIKSINTLLKLGDYSKTNNRNDLILKEYNKWLLSKGYRVWLIDNGQDCYNGFVIKISDATL
jgi:hypothetical protein